MVSNIVRIQLIDGDVQGFLDVKENVAFPLNFAISDIRDIGSRTGSFSKSIKLAGTKNNNLLLNNYFDVNVKNGTFNLNKIQKCAIIQNGIVIKDNYFLRLLKVVKIQNRGEEIDDIVEYEVQVRDSLGDFFKEIDNKEIVDLDGWGLYNHNYNIQNVVDSFNHTWQDGYKYVLPWIGAPDPFNYGLSELTPGVYAKQIFDKIHEQAGYEYEWNDLTDDNVLFDKLIIPYFGDKKKLSEEDKDLNTVIVQNTSSFTTPAGTTNFQGNTQVGWFRRVSLTNIPTPTEIKDLQDYFDPTTSTYTNQFIVTPPNSLEYEVTINFDFIIENFDSLNCFLISGQVNTFTPRLQIRDGNNNLKGITNLTFTALDSNNTVQNVCQLSNNNQTVRFNGVSLIGAYYYFAPGDTVIANGNITTTISVSDLTVGNTLKLGIDSSISQGYGTFWNNTNFQASDVRPKIRVNNITVNIAPSSNDGILPNTPISLKSFLPKKIKQSEFLKSIYQKYNLYAEIDPQNPNKIVYVSRDDYYDSGVFKDWTFKLNKEKPQELFFVPEISSKKLILSYKDDDNDAGLTAYRGEVGETYGQVEIEFENENVRGVERKEELFSPTLNLPTEFNGILPVLAPDFKMNMRILIDGGNYPCDTYTISQSPNDSISLTQYPYMGLLDKPTNPTFSIEYAQPDYYPYNPGLLTQNNLYVNYWRRTLAQINSGKLLKAYFWLTEEDIFKLKLNDKVKVNNALWYINKIVDYDANTHKPTLVELLSVEDDLKLPRFGRNIKPIPVGVATPVPAEPVKPVRPVLPIAVGVSDIIRKRTESTSVFNGVTDTSNNMGVRNLITKDFTGIIIGNDQIVDENGFYIDGTKMTSSEINIQDTTIINQNGISVGNTTYGIDGITIYETYIDDGYYDSGYTITNTSTNSFGYDELNNEITFTIDSDNVNIKGNNKIQFGGDYNNKTFYFSEVTTSGNTLATGFTYNPNIDNIGVSIKATVVGETNPYSSNIYYSEVNGFFNYLSGSTTQISTIDNIEKTTFTGATSNIVISGSDIVVEVTGETGVNINWKLKIEIN
jgi:hypothetical protein